MYYGALRSRPGAGVYKGSGVNCQKRTRQESQHKKGNIMPEQQTLERAQKARRQGKAPTTQAGEFVREEMHHIREGKHGARNTKQAIAIGLSKARRAGVKLRPPRKGRATQRTRRQAERAYAQGQRTRFRRPSTSRSRATLSALRRERRSSASPLALSRQARSAALRRSPQERSRAAWKAARTKGPAARSRTARRAAQTRRR